MSRQLLDRSVRRPTAFAHKGAPVRPFEDSHTHLRLVSVGNAVIREVIEHFDAAFEAALGAPLSSYGVVAHVADDRPVSAVAYVARTLGVPETDVLEAAGIKERTFHEWKKHHRSPRLASQGRLWKLVQSVEDLECELDSPKLWLKADPLRRALLRSGDIDELMAWAVADSAQDPWTPGAASGYALGPEVLVPSVSDVRAVRRRPTAQRRAGRRSDG